MPRRNGSSSPSTSPKSDSPLTGKGKQKVEWKGYVNWTLSEQHKATFKKWLETEPKIDELIQKVTEDGYDLKIRYDAYNACMSAQLYCTNVLDGNAGWCLSMRSSDWYTAVLRVLYVHFVALEEVWSDNSAAGWTDDNW